MGRKKKYGFVWNGIILVTMVSCVLAFVVHYKNWHRFKDGEFQVLSGIYVERIPIEDLVALEWKARMPQMEREHGFSWLTREKGVFKDSLTGGRVHVFVDDLEQPKIQIQYRDSLKLYLNLKDSVKTQTLFDKLKALKEPETR